MVNNWIAEDLPAYLVDGTSWRPKNDEDVAMSAPCTLIKGASEGEARDAMRQHLEMISRLGFVSVIGESEMYRTAAQEFLADRTEFRPHVEGGRFFRISQAEGSE